MRKTPEVDLMARTERIIESENDYRLEEVVTADFARQLERDRAELVDVVNAFVDETVDYMTLNKLGNPEDQHNVKRARALLDKVNA